jgi:putative ABC transport system permease protein
MKFWDLISFIVENIKRQKGRVFLTSLGVVIGSASIILLVALVGGLQQTATAQFTGNKDLTKIEVSAGYGRYVSGKSGSNRTDSSTSTQKSITDDIIKQFSALDHVAAVVPEQSLGSSSLTYRLYTARTSVIGVGTADLASLGVKATEGSLELKHGFAIIGSKVTSNFYRMNYAGKRASLSTDLLDKELKLTLSKTSSGKTSRKIISLKVSGILKETSSQADYAIYIPMQDADAITYWSSGTKVDHTSDSYSSVIIQANDTNSVTDIAAQITDLGFQAQTPASFLDNVNSLFLVLQLVFGGVGAITLLVAAIGIANTMTMAILERTKEIGLLKALGATNQDVLTLFLGESTGIGLIGGIGGTALGIILGNVINAIAVPYLQKQAEAQNSSTVPTSAVYIPFYLPIFVLLFSMLIGSLSGLYPSLRAASLPPVIALKHE